MWWLFGPVLFTLVSASIVQHHRRVKERRAASSRADREKQDGTDIENQQSDETTESDQEPLGSTVLECSDLKDWLVDGRSRLGIVDEPRVERVDVAGATATRITFQCSDGRCREIWSNGPAFLSPLPRVRCVDWHSDDKGFVFERNSASLERAVLQTSAKRVDSVSSNGVTTCVSPST